MPDPIVLDPDVEAFLRVLAGAGGPPIHTLSPAEARDVLSSAQQGDFDLPECTVEDRVLPVGPSGEVRVRIVRPADIDEDDALPVVMYFHGGGWVLGGPDTHDRLVRELAIGAGAAVVLVDYSRSPEARYPVAVEEAYAATLWIAEHGGTLGLDTTGLAVAGDSAGGNMATVVAMLAKQRDDPVIDLQVLFYPVTDAAMDTPSYEAYADGPWLTRAAMRWFWDQYAPDPATRALPTVSPLRASLDDLRDLPPALVITAEHDVLRDEGEAYARRLMQAGVPVTAVRYLGTIHDFAMLNAITATAAARGAIAQAADYLWDTFES
jgi:acetyl esterase